MCCTYSIICWSNKKRFFNILVVFGKCFCFEKFQKIQKFLTLLFGDSLMSHANRKAPVASLHRSFHDSLASKTSSREKHLEKFSKIWGFGHFRDCFASKALIVRLLREVCDSLVGGCPNREKDRQIFRNFVKGFLVTWFGDLLTGHMSRENRIFYTNRVKSQLLFKNFSVFPHIMCTPFVFSTAFQVVK